MLMTCILNSVVIMMFRNLNNLLVEDHLDGIKMITHTNRALPYREEEQIYSYIERYGKMVYYKTLEQI